MMKRVYICAPLGGNVDKNLQKVKDYTRYALMCGTAPVVPHFYALCLNDRNPKEREIGMMAGLSLLWFCDEMWIFGDEETEGMKSEIQFCKSVNIVFPVVDMILAILFFVKVGTSYFEYRKHGQFEFTAPAILSACLIFTLTAPLYIWTIL